MQGNCSDAEPPRSDTLMLPMNTAPLSPLKPRQCVVVFGGDLFAVDESKLWLDNLYFRYRAGSKYWLFLLE